MCLTNGVELPAAVPFEQRFEVLRVDEHVIVGINRSCGTKESHGTTFTIKDSGLTDIVCLTVKRHDITRGGNPERQIGIHEILEISQSQYSLMRKTHRTTMTAIVHDQGSVSLLLLHQCRYIRIGVTRGR